MTQNDRHDPLEPRTTLTLVAILLVMVVTFFVIFHSTPAGGPFHVYLGVAFLVACGIVPLVFNFFVTRNKKT